MDQPRRKSAGFAQRAKGFCHRFGRNEDGVISLQFLWQFPFMLWFGYIAIDVMMHEFERTRLQNTLDRAVLAAADLDQEGVPEEVVRSYFRAAGIEDSIDSINVKEGLNLRNVEATATISVPTVFLNATDSGYRNNQDTPYVYDNDAKSLDNFEARGSSLPARATGAAEESVSNVEISLVLDVSGSMANNGRIGRMRTAASEFIDAVIQEGENGMTTVSIVPYSAVVNVGPYLAPSFSMTTEHSYSNCMSFDSSDFNTTAISLSKTYQRVAHFDPFSNDQNSTEIAQPWCPTGLTATLWPIANDTANLKAYINSLQANGNTAIDVGMKWGAGFLDPAFRPVAAKWAGRGWIDGRAASRPAAFDDEDTLKVIVLMTDGENTSQYDLKDYLRSGNSNIWVDERGNTDPRDDRFSYDLSAYNYGTVYFWERLEQYEQKYRYWNSIDGGSNARRMTYPETFARWGTTSMAYKFIERPYYDGRAPIDLFYKYAYAYEEKVNAAGADSRLNAICTASKNNNIVIFSVAFEAPEAGKNALRNCASTESHFFDVNGVEIEEVFSAIGRQINQLRLVQ